MAGLRAPLPTLRRRPRGRRRTARGRCGSLLLHRSGLAPPTPCRSPGALAHADRDERVAPLQPGPETFEGCEHVGPVVGDAAGAIQDVALPGWTEKGGR